MKRRNRHINYASVLGPGDFQPEDHRELPRFYYERALDELAQDYGLQRDFVHSEFLDLYAVTQMIAGNQSPDAVLSDLRSEFRDWIGRFHEYRVTTTAWSIYDRDRKQAEDDRAEDRAADEAFNQ